MVNRILVGAVGAAMLSPLAQGQTLFHADFEGMTLGAPPPQLANQTHPAWIDLNLTATVEDSSTVTAPTLLTGQFCRLDGDAGEAPDMGFDRGVSWSSGLVEMSVDVLFESLGQYHIYLREGSAVGGAAERVFDLVTATDGSGAIETLAHGSGDSIFTPFSYAAGELINYRAVFDLDADTVDIWANGAQLADDVEILDDASIGLFIIGFEFAGFTGDGPIGVMQYDNLVVRRVPTPGTLALFAASALVLGRRRR